MAGKVVPKKTKAPSNSPKGESHVSASTVRSLHSPLGELEGALGELEGLIKTSGVTRVTEVTALLDKIESYISQID